MDPDKPIAGSGSGVPQEVKLSVVCCVHGYRKRIMLYWRVRVVWPRTSLPQLKYISMYNQGDRSSSVKLHHTV